MDRAMFGAGCFWGVEDSFRNVKGVEDAAVGYSGGATPDPSYEAVCTDTTGHAEVVELSFDAKAISYETLLYVFWSMHDPTTLNRQGPDFGSQYRSVIFYYNDEQRRTAEASKAALEASGKHNRPVVTEITAAGPFYRAEDYHQEYLAKRGLGSCHTPQT